MKELKVGFIGAGARARGAHYPCVSRLEGVRIVAVAEMNEDRMREVVQRYNIPNAFLCKDDTDYKRMLDSIELDVVYVIAPPQHMAQPAIGCMNAGKHVFIEKPAGANSDESLQLLEAALSNDVYCMVGYQRRYAAVTQEAMRLVGKRGPATLAMGEFHKPGDYRRDNMEMLWSDVCHVVDLVRYMIGSDPVEVTAFQDDFVNGRRNSFNGLIRFANRAVGIVTACRHSGGRYLRAELHGIGIGCYMRLPERIEIYEDGRGPRVLSGAEVAGVDPEDVDSYEGVLAMHQHFVDCIRNGQIPCSDIRDAVHTSLLVDKMAGGVW